MAAETAASLKKKEDALRKKREALESKTRKAAKIKGLEKELAALKKKK